MIWFGIFVALVGCLPAADGIYLVVLAAASFFYSQRLDGFVPTLRLVVVIPAHDEEMLVARTVQSLLEQDYPRSLYQVCVIADNCTDATAAAAIGAGADRVMTRDEPQARGKGRALRWAMDQILEGSDAPDAIVSVDADTVADRELLRALAQRLEAGAPAVQADYRATGDDSPASALRKIGFILMNRTRPAGRNACGLSACLVGNGWGLSAELLRKRPWSAFTSTEDREYTIELDSAGEFLAFAGAAAVHAPTAPSRAAEIAQQERWEGGWATLVRRNGARLLLASVKQRKLAPLLVSLDLAVPPLGLLASLSLAGLLLDAAITLVFGLPLLLMVPWAVAILAVPSYVLMGLVAAGAPRSAYLALAHAPLFVLRKPLSLGRTLRFRSDTWVRTERVQDRAENNA